jgi:hypothetical protein
MSNWLDGPRVVALAIIVAVLVTAWMMRYKPISHIEHRNRITGAVCFIDKECWFKSNF